MILGLPLALSGSAKRGGLPVTNGLKLYLNADKGITIGTGVSAWADQSGNGNHVSQGTPANQPAFVSSWRNGKAALQGAASKNLARATLVANVGQPLTLLTVGSWSGGTTTMLVDGTGADRICVGNTAGNLWSLSHGALTAGGGTGKSADTPFFAISRFASAPESNSDAVVGTAGLDESFSIDPDGVEDFFPGINIGSTFANTANWTGKIACIVMWNRLLTAGEMTAINKWARSYYGI